jgi:tRNA(Arg) A34 adenosine deaminase TadA
MIKEYFSPGFTSVSDEQFLARAVALAAASASAGGFPSGALVVSDGSVIGEGVSRARLVADPTAHAEVCAIRAGAARIGGGLSGATLYTALEPCLMCLHSAYWAGVARIVYGSEKAHFKAAYYEGCGSLAGAGEVLNRRIVLEYLAGFEGRIADLVENWEKGQRRLGLCR